MIFNTNSLLITGDAGFFGSVVIKLFWNLIHNRVIYVKSNFILSSNFVRCYPHEY